MKPQLVLGLNQRITMTPQLVQSIRLLQLSAVELEQEIREALETNVLLEKDEHADRPQEGHDPVTAAETGVVELQRTDAGHEGWNPSGAGGSEFDSESRWAEAEPADPRGRVLQQIALTIDDPRELAVAVAIVDAVDDCGYLTVPLSDIRRSLPPSERMRLADMERLLALIQRLDPAGFAARNLRECLQCQLEELSADTRGRPLALRLVAEHLDLLAYGDGAELAACLEVPISAVTAAVALIQRLNPKPGASTAAAAIIIPDLVLTQQGQGWVVALNPAAMPRLRINAGYERVINEQAVASALKDQLQEARWLVRSVQMRQETLLATGQAIFARQQGFLERGEEGLAPLTLREIADSVGVHESTVSRITSSKFVQTPRGVFPLKTFFPSQLAGAEGVNASGAAVKAMIRRLVANEPAHKPLRDVDIAAILARRGIRVARRTVAKYREAQGIASSRDRQNAAPRTALVR